MGKKKYGILLDTEYTRRNKMVTNLACYVIDIHGNVYEEMNFFNKNLNPKKKMKLCDASQIELTSWDHTMETLQSYIKEYNVTFLVGYNIMCDMVAIYKTCKAYNAFTNFFAKNKLEYIDLALLAQNHIGTRNYRKYCVLNNELTQNNNEKLTVEVMYRYITNDSGFTQNHTALNDCQIELIIYRKCRQKKKKYPENAYRNVEKILRKHLDKKCKA